MTDDTMALRELLEKGSDTTLLWNPPAGRLARMLALRKAHHLYDCHWLGGVHYGDNGHKLPARRPDRSWPVALKRDIVVALLASGASVSVVARQRLPYCLHAGLFLNQVFCKRAAC